MAVNADTWKIICDATPTLCDDLETGYITDTTFVTMKELAKKQGIDFKDVNQLGSLLGRAIKNPPLVHIHPFWKAYLCIRKEQRDRIKWAKRALVDAAQFTWPGRVTLQSLANELGIAPIPRMRSVVPGAKQYYSLVEPGNEEFVPKKKRAAGRLFVVGIVADPDWYTVQANQDVIFVNPDTGMIEIVVIRKVTGFNPGFLDYFGDVIWEAGGNRRGCRPGHGTLVQAGLLRYMIYDTSYSQFSLFHLRVFGLVNNLKNKKLDTDIKYAKDRDILGILAFTWNLILARIPAEIMDPILGEIEKSGMPAIDAAGFEDTTGYSIKFAGEQLDFPSAQRAPAEGYLAENYHAHIHRDKSFSPKHAFTWQTNYVDITLKVTVHSAADTLLVFRPEFPHGTTMARPEIYRSGIAIVFSAFIHAAFEKAMKNIDQGIMVERVPAVPVDGEFKDDKDVHTF